MNIMLLPFQGVFFLFDVLYPGRCPGLIAAGLSGRRCPGLLAAGGMIFEFFVIGKKKLFSCMFDFKCFKRWRLYLVGSLKD